MTEKLTTQKVIQIDHQSKGFFDDLDAIRIDQNFADQIGVEKIITKIPVRRPDRQEWFRVHPDNSLHIQLALIEDRLDRTYYVIDQDLALSLPDEVVLKKLYYSINRRGVVFLWPVKMPDSTGRLDDWNKSSHKAAMAGMKRWIRIGSNRSLGAYEIFTSKAGLEDPTWPELTLNQVLEIAFEDRIIREYDHPFLRELRGEE